MKRFFALLLSAVLFLGMIPVPHAEAAAKFPDSIYIKPTLGGETCTLVSAAMAIRARLYLSGNTNWSIVTEHSIFNTAWIGGKGLRHSFTYYIDGNSVSMNHADTSGISVASLKSLLDAHPEGIVLYCGDLPHAVFVSDYDGNTFYCGDPSEPYSGSRRTLSSSWLGYNYEYSQEKILNNVTAYWYVSGYNIANNSVSDIGTDFTAPILNTAAWKVLENCYTEGDKPPVRIAAYESTYANQLWYFSRQSDGSYKISSCYDGKYLDVRDANMGAGAVIQTCVDSGSDAQKWYISNVNGSYVLRSKLSGYVVDLINNDATGGNQIQTWNYNGSNAQIWSIYKGDESKLSAPVVTVNPGTSDSQTYFAWKDVYGEKGYHLRIWQGSSTTGSAYLTKGNVLSGVGVKLPAGTYTVLVQAYHHYDQKNSTPVTFTVKNACNHDFSPWIEITAASCTAEGLERRTCRNNCGTTEDRTIPVKDHTYENRICIYCGKAAEFWEFDKNTGTLTIYGNGPMPDYTGIDTEDTRPWASVISQIKHIVVSKGVTTIGNSTFRGCSNLVSVTLPEGITSIGSMAFYNCTSLDNVTLPDSLTTFGEGAFMNCDSLSEIVIPGKMKTITARVFASCDTLAQVTLPEGLSEIGNMSFQSCISLKEISIPDTVTQIKNAFSYCTGLERVTLSKNLERLDGGFSKCTSLKKITIPASVSVIGQSSFSFCKDIEIYFVGDAPKFQGANPSPFTASTLTIYYPEDNDTWTSNVMKQYGGTITWVPYDPSGNTCDHTYGSWEITTAAGCETTGAKTRTCTLCSKQETESIPPTGHDWNTTVIPANCQHTQKTRSVCRNCGDEQLESEPMEYSEWVEILPDDVIQASVETMTQYRYRDRLNTWSDPVTHTVEYAWPQDTEDWQGVDRSGTFYQQYNHVPVSASETNSEKVTEVSTEHIGYLYFHWCKGRVDGPYNRVISNCYETDYPYFHAFTSTEAGSDYDTNGAYGATAKYLYNNACCTDTWWWRQIPIYRQTYTVQTKAQSTDGWGEWSEWFSGEVTSSETRQIQERTLYRYVTNLGEHTYTDGDKAHCSVCTHFREDDTPGISPSQTDYNRDGAVTAEDAIYLVWHNLFPGLYPVSLSGDANGDGTADMQDAAYLLWYALDLL